MIVDYDTPRQIIILTFEDKDWRENTIGVQNAIGCIKSLGPVRKNPDGFSYDPIDRQWRLRHTPENVAFAEQLKKEFCL